MVSLLLATFLDWFMYTSTIVSFVLGNFFATCRLVVNLTGESRMSCLTFSHKISEELSYKAQLIRESG